jgi:fatty acid desaturase
LETLGLAIVAAGLLVRIFIYFHDCAHQSFFAARKANTVLGYICGVLTFTASLTIGFKAYALIQFPVIFFAGRA